MPSNNSIKAAKSGLPKGKTIAKAPNKKPFIVFDKYIGDCPTVIEDVKEMLTHSKFSAKGSTGGGKSYLMQHFVIPTIFKDVKDGSIKSPKGKPIAVVLLSPLVQLTRQQDAGLKRSPSNKIPFATICGGEDEQGNAAFDSATTVDIKKNKLFNCTFKQGTRLLYRLEKAGFDVICIVDESHECLVGSYQNNPSLWTMINECFKSFLFSATPKTKAFEHYGYNCVSFLRRETPTFNTFAITDIPKPKILPVAIKLIISILKRGKRVLVKLDNKNQLRELENYLLSEKVTTEMIYSGLPASEIKKLKSLITLALNGTVSDSTDVLIGSRKLFLGQNFITKGFETIYIPTKEAGRDIDDFAQARHRTRYDIVTTHILCGKYEGNEFAAKEIDLDDLELERKKAKNVIETYAIFKRLNKVAIEYKGRELFDYKGKDFAGVYVTYCPVKDNFVFDDAKYFSEKYAGIAKATSNDDFLEKVRRLEGTKLSVKKYDKNDITEAEQVKAEQIQEKVKQEKALTTEKVGEWFLSKKDNKENPTEHRQALMEFVESQTKDDYLTGSIRAYIGESVDDYNWTSEKLLSEKVDSLDYTYGDLFTYNFTAVKTFVSRFFRLKNAVGKRNDSTSDDDFVRMVVSNGKSKDFGLLISRLQSLRIIKDIEYINGIDISKKYSVTGISRILNAWRLISAYDCIKKAVDSSDSGEIKGVDLVNLLNNHLRKRTELTKEYTVQTLTPLLKSMYDVKTDIRKEGEFKNRNVTYYIFSGLLNFNDVYNEAIGIDIEKEPIKLSIENKKFEAIEYTEATPLPKITYSVETTYAITVDEKADTKPSKAAAEPTRQKKAKNPTAKKQIVDTSARFLNFENTSNKSQTLDKKEAKNV